MVRSERRRRARRRSLRAKGEGRRRLRETSAAVPECTGSDSAAAISARPSCRAPPRRCLRPLARRARHRDAPTRLASSRTPNTITPAMSSRPPSACVPSQRHSDHAVSPTASMRTSSARKSGTAAKTADQFARTCSRPRRPGRGGGLRAVVVLGEARDTSVDVAGVHRRVQARHHLFAHRACVGRHVRGVCLLGSRSR
jgi:hypothetical protein